MFLFKFQLYVIFFLLYAVYSSPPDISLFVVRLWHHQLLEPQTPPTAQAAWRAAFAQEINFIVEVTACYTFLFTNEHHAD